MSPYFKELVCHHSLLAVGNLVPNSHTDGHRSATPDRERGGSSSTRKRSTHPRQESTLVIKRLANKRIRLASKGYSDEVLSITVVSNAEKQTLRSYAPAQQRYIAWALQQDIDQGLPSPTQLVNWLAGGVAAFDSLEIQNYPQKLLFWSNRDLGSPFWHPIFAS
ncbi:hypothetical protein EDD21DRAFT_353037 [Dissophora ornata]|nr:hypothetical protein EDD21DRAFT_353037 [Dissophora ornata]